MYSFVLIIHLAIDRNGSIFKINLDLARIDGWAVANRLFDKSITVPGDCYTGTYNIYVMETYLI